MLPAAHRLTSAAHFRTAVRRGRRRGSSSLVAHLLLTDDAGPARVGFVVSKAVGGAVVRNRVKRRLRHLVAERLALLPAGSLLVVRAMPPAAGSTYDELGADLDRVLRLIASAPAPAEAAVPSAGAAT